VEAPAPGRSPPAAPALTFRSNLIACLPHELQERMAALECSNMTRPDGSRRFAVNGSPFEDYFSNWELMAHVALDADGSVAGFAITGSESRGKKLFVYELHVRDKRRGLGRALLELAEGAGANAKRRTPPMVELNVHLENDAQAFYTHLGFAESGRTRDGLAIVMRRQRA
jgi:ribosomal protein S18 acetylase RimI-like enzyme